MRCTSARVERREPEVGRWRAPRIGNYSDYRERMRNFTLAVGG